MFFCRFSKLPFFWACCRAANLRFHARHLISRCQKVGIGDPWMGSSSKRNLGGGSSNIFHVHPENWGRWTQFDLRIFFRWVGKNRQPETNGILVAVFFFYDQKRPASHDDLGYANPNIRFWGKLRSKPHDVFTWAHHNDFSRRLVGLGFIVICPYSPIQLRARCSIFYNNLPGVLKWLQFWIKWIPSKVKEINYLVRGA